MNVKICAFTGYRPEKLPFGNDESSRDCETFKQQLFCNILRMTREGTRIFITGMARGVDTWAAEAVLMLRKTMPFMGIQLWAAVPYDRQARAWNKADQVRYAQIRSKADRVKYISHEYTSSCIRSRNQWMIDQASHLLAVYDGQPRGTKSTIEYARKKGLEITIIKP